MAEKLETYDLQGNPLGTYDRKKFYEEINQEYRDTGAITRKVKSIRMLVVNSKGNIYVQMRSDEKERNPGLYDKTIGGHLQIGQTWNLTVVKECHEELGFPAVVLTDDEFRSAIKETKLHVIGLVRQVEFIENFVSVNNLKGEIIKQPFITAFYVGYYDGPIHFTDGESTGIRVFSIEQLQKKIEEQPDLFTADLKFMIDRYAKYLTPLNKDETNVVEGF